jgi:hypothetical protein
MGFDPNRAAAAMAIAFPVDVAFEPDIGEFLFGIVLEFASEWKRYLVCKLGIAVQLDPRGRLRCEY